jgi:ribosome-binding protein aMBF1 (putative translation factor)
MTKINKLHRIWSKDPTYLKEYDALEEEFTVMAAIAKARRRSGLSQAELARRMNTTQSTVARLESGRGQPSTRTPVRFAKATVHRLKISFRPVKVKR